MPTQITLHLLSLLVVLLCLVAMVTPRRINCRRYPFHNACRGISAKRSFSPSSSSSSSSLSSSSSTAPRLNLLNRLMLLSHNAEDRIDDQGLDKDAQGLPSSLGLRLNLQQPQQHHLQQQQQQKQRQYRQQPFDGDSERRGEEVDDEDEAVNRLRQHALHTIQLDSERRLSRTLVRDLIMAALGSKDYGLDVEDTT